MGKRKQYDDSRFLFVTTTNPYATPDRDVQTHIRRQAMKDAGIARRSRNKQKKEQQRQLQTPPSSVASPMPRPGPEPLSTYLQGEAASCNNSDLAHNGFSYKYSGICTPEPSDHESQSNASSVEDDSLIKLEPYCPEFNTALSIAGKDPFGTLPVTLDPIRDRLFTYLVHTLTYMRLPNIRSWWLDAAIQDPGMFDQKLAISASHLGIMRGVDGRQDLVASWYLNNVVIKNVNKRLAGPEKDSDGVLTAIIGLAYQVLDPRFVSPHVHHGWWIHLTKPADWLPHVEHAHCIVEARGGIDSIDSNRPLRQELYWIDLISASDLDIQPRYPLQPHQSASINATVREARLVVAQSGVLCSLPADLYSVPDSEPLRRTLKTLYDMKLIIAAERLQSMSFGTQPWSDGDATVAWINPLTHRLQSLALRSRPLDPVTPPTDPIMILCETARLATLLYTYAVRALPGTKPPPIIRQSVGLASILQLSCVLWASVPLLRLWAMAVLTLCTNSESISSWLLVAIREEAESLRITNTERLLHALRRVAWEKEFSRVALDQLWTVPREVTELPEQPNMAYPQNQHTYARYSPP